MDDPAGICVQQRLGDVPQAQEVDRDDQQRVADSGGHTGDVEQRVDVPADRGDRGSIDAASVRSTAWNSAMSQLGRCLSSPTTSAPSSVSCRTTCAPMPDAHPVTTARRPS